MVSHSTVAGFSSSEWSCYNVQDIYFLIEITRKFQAQMPATRHSKLQSHCCEPWSFLWGPWNHFRTTTWSQWSSSITTKVCLKFIMCAEWFRGRWVVDVQCSSC